jgi:hypothetical protein
MPECPTISDCPHCHGSHIILYEPFPASLGNKGRWWYVCGLNAEEQAPEPEVDKSLFKRIPTGPRKVLRTFTCFICQETITGLFYPKQMICPPELKESCGIKRNRLYAAWVLSGRPLEAGKKWYER